MNVAFNIDLIADGKLVAALQEPRMKFAER